MQPPQICIRNTKLLLFSDNFAAAIKHHEAMPLLSSSASKIRKQGFIMLIFHCVRKKAGRTERKAIGLTSDNVI